HGPLPPALPAGPLVRPLLRVRPHPRAALGVGRGRARGRRPRSRRVRHPGRPRGAHRRRGRLPARLRGPAQMSPVRVVVARGDPLERGRTVGWELADLIRGSLEFYWRYLVRRGVGAGELSGLLAPYLAAAERELPDLVELVTGMAEGAGVSFWELFCVNAFEELDPLLATPSGTPRERCSTVTISGPGYTLLGHNEQWLAGDVGHVAVVVELPDDGPALVSPTLACCLPAVGMNEYRVAQGIQSLVANDDGVGIPRVLVSRHALVASSPADALRRATLPGPAGGYGHSFALGTGSPHPHTPRPPPRPAPGPPCPAGPGATATASPSAPARPCTSRPAPPGSRSTACPAATPT